MSGPESYAGLVVGGPAAGEFVKLPTEVYRAIPKPAGPPAGMPSSATMDPDGGRRPVDYRHTTMHYVTEGRTETILGFWVPFEVAHPNLYVVETLAAAYRKGGAK